MQKKASLVVEAVPARLKQRLSGERVQSLRPSKPNTRTTQRRNLHIQSLSSTSTEKTIRIGLCNNTSAVHTEARKELQRVKYILASGLPRAHAFIDFSSQHTIDYSQVSQLISHISNWRPSSSLYSFRATRRVWHRHLLPQRTLDRGKSLHRAPHPTICKIRAQTVAQRLQMQWQ